MNVVRQSYQEGELLDIEMFVYHNDMTPIQIRELRFSDMNLTWSFAESIVLDKGDQFNLEMKLEALEWLDNQRPLRFEHIPDDQLLIRDNQLGIEVSIDPLLIDLSQFDDIIAYIDKHRLINIPVQVEIWRDDCLTSYCELIDYPLKRISQNNIPSGEVIIALHNNDQTEIDQLIIDKIKVEYGYNTEYRWTVESLYRLLLHPQLISGGDDEKFFFLLINIDHDMEYCIDPAFNEMWTDIIAYDCEKNITNRKAFLHIKKLEIGLWDTNCIFKYYQLGFNDELVGAYYMADMVDRFKYLDKLVECVVDNNKTDYMGYSNYYGIGIMMRLLKRRIIDLRPYAGSHPIIDHLLQYQPRINIKSAR